MRAIKGLWALYRFLFCWVLTPLAALLAHQFGKDFRREWIDIVYPKK